MALAWAFAQLDYQSSIMANEGTQTRSRQLEEHPKMFQRIVQDLQLKGIRSPFYSQFINQRLDSIPEESWTNFRLDELPLDLLNKAKFITNGSQGRGS